MFQEKNLIYQERAPRGGKENLPSRPKPDTSASRREIMPLTPTRATAYKMIDDVFCKVNREKILAAIDPQSMQTAIEDLGMNFLKPPHNLKYKGTFQEFGKRWLTFDDHGKEVKYKFETLFFITEEKMKELLAMTKTPSLNMRALERRADIYIMGRVIEMILNYGPDRMPDDILDRILKTELIPKIRKVLIEAYKRGREYKMTTSEKGFTLETGEPKDPGLPDKVYDMEKFWREIDLGGKGGRSLEPEYIDISSTLDKEAILSSVISATWEDPLGSWKDSVLDFNSEFQDFIRKLEHISEEPIKEYEPPEEKTVLRSQAVVDAEDTE